MVWMLAPLLALGAAAAELKFDFGQFPLDQPPKGFSSAVAGEGRPGDWRVILDDVPSAFHDFTANAPALTKRSVLAQTARQALDEHFPLLIFEGEVFGDFTLTTRFKLEAGELERMAGIAFRLQDEKNFYVIRASGPGSNVRFYKVVDGQRSTPIGPTVEVPTGVWHTLRVDCRGNRIRAWLNDREVLPTLVDNTFTRGRFAFWTKSDSVSFFADTRIEYTPLEQTAQKLVRELMREYPRLVGLQLYVPGEAGQPPQLLAADPPAPESTTGGSVEADTLQTGNIYQQKKRETVVVTLPLRDRNGDIIAAVRIKMKRFAGQTEQNVLARTLPIMRWLQHRIRSDAELRE